MDSISIKVEVLAGSDIPQKVIPEMVKLANKLDIGVEANLNTVTTIAYPGDEAFDLAIAWRRAMRSKNTHAMAFARDGKIFMEQS